MNASRDNSSDCDQSRGAATDAPRPIGDERAPEWYAQGLSFECTQCGNCCSGPTGYVWFNADEGRRMAAHLGEDERGFYDRFARKIHGRWSLREYHTKAHGYNCVFLDRESQPGKALCSIYAVRPTQCRTWPFWPENLASREEWEAVKRRTPCPGMDRGAKISLVQIRIQRDTATG